MSLPAVKTNDMESDTSSSDIARNTETTALTKQTQQLSDGKKQGEQEKKKKKKTRSVSVTVGTTGGSERVAGLIASLRSMDDVVNSVNFREIPYNVRDMDHFEFDDVDVFILCHSITNRRLSITDVSDALYDKLLLRACQKLGKKNVIIVGYDFKDNDLQPNVLASKLNAVRIQQPTACEKSSAIVFAGQCATSPPGLPDVMLEKLRSSLQASSPRKSGCSPCSCFCILL
ncbi:uncharacterized protein [Diadema antillarum]|uniref:uncharacterized protein n=1 Tax=Diadema antillarum TaxID=105358 RepID=UPI003A8C0A05